jgi:uncharacterized membrane protein YdjX (TVP38/TMEM64 family)
MLLLAALVCCFLIGVAVAARLLPELFALTPEDVEAFVARWGAWGAAASMLLMVLHSFVPVPAEIIAIANGMVFGVLLGVAITWAGAMLGALSAFALARGAGRPLLCRLVAAERRGPVEAWTRRAGSLLLLRLLPVVSFNAVNFAAGLAGVGWWRFLWTTALGILPLTIASVVLGARMFAIPWPVWLALTALLLALWPLLRRLRRAAFGAP